MTREEARTILRETCVTPYIHPDGIGKFFDAMKMAIEALEQQPKTGHWVEKEFSVMAGASAKCSECGEYAKGIGHDNGFSMDYTFYDYCPHCGAKMEEPTET